MAAKCRLSFPGVKRSGRGVDHPPSSSAEVKERVELCLCSPSEPSWPVLGRILPLPYVLFNRNVYCAVQWGLKQTLHQI
jgi:hypothetical protein